MQECRNLLLEAEIVWTKISVYLLFSFQTVFFYYYYSKGSYNLVALPRFTVTVKINFKNNLGEIVWVLLDICLWPSRFMWKGLWATSYCTQVTIRATRATYFMQLLPKLVILPPSSAPWLLQVMHRTLWWLSAGVPRTASILSGPAKLIKKSN